MILLALDTSVTRTGWCKGALDGPVTTGSFKTRVSDRDDIGALMKAFRDEFLETLHQDAQCVVFEQPARVFGQQNFLGVRRNWSLQNMVELWAVDRGIPCLEVNTQSAKKTMYGKGGKKPDNTHGIAQAWGFTARNDDEADACAVFLHHCRNHHPDTFKRFEDVRMGRAETA